KVGEQALYLAQLKGLSHHEALVRLREWFTRFEIQGWWNRKVEELSKGMQQKVQFIVTVVHRPRLLIFDEPFSGFDPINVNLLKEEILRLKAEGSTILFSTHNMASVEELCDHIVLINKAQTILHGSVHDIKQAYKSNTFEADLLGFSGGEQDLPLEGIELLSFSRANGIASVRARLAPGQSPNQLLRSLMPLGQVQGFREIIPSMNDIFIRRVNEDKARI
ncbi:MAG TPA: ATP-binding cassette domain-containing protein, partial [Bacteroidales bacterium]|nr:ATP-binding cassette domain-containing protein [Bacteroidales bacterium]